MRAVPRLFEAKSLVKRAVAQVRQELDPPAQERLAVAAKDRRGREVPVLLVVLVHRHAEAMQLTEALLALVLTKRVVNSHRHQKRDNSPDHSRRKPGGKTPAGHKGPRCRVVNPPNLGTVRC